MNNCKPKQLPRQKQILGLLPTCTRRTEDVLLQYKLITNLKTKTNTMKNATKMTDFNFERMGYGHFRVTYKSSKTKKQWTTITTDMQLIDETLHSDNPKNKDLEILKRKCKNQY